MIKSKTKVCYILSYKAPDYIRTRVLINALSEMPSVNLSRAINSTPSVWRYLQTLWRLLFIRLTKHPNVYILGFRGQEIYWPVRLLTIGRPLIFDEFINMHDWLSEENNKLPKFIIYIAQIYEKLVLKSCQLILTDTNLGVKSSSQSYSIPQSKYQTIYVGTDEKLFYPRSLPNPDGKKLEVFFYGNMAPLHGVEYILEAANILKNYDIKFLIIGGKGKPDQIKSIKNYIKSNSLNNVEYREWANINEISDLIAATDLFLGGPFGNSSQSKRVITGKTFQALSSAKATVIGKIDEQVGFSNKENCLLVDQASTSELTNAILWSYKNKSKLIDLGNAGNKLYSQRFSHQKVAESLREAINKVFSLS